MPCRRLRRWHGINVLLGQHPMFAGSVQDWRLDWSFAYCLLVTIDQFSGLVGHPPPPPVTGILALDRRVTGGPGDSDLVTSHWGADSLGPRFLHWCRLLRRCILIRTATSFSVTMCGASHTALKQAIHPLTNVFTFLSRSSTLISWGVSVEDTICDLFSRNLLSHFAQC